MKITNFPTIFPSWMECMCLYGKYKNITQKNLLLHIIRKSQKNVHTAKGNKKNGADMKYDDEEGEEEIEEREKNCKK